MGTIRPNKTVLAPRHIFQEIASSIKLNVGATRQCLRRGGPTCPLARTITGKSLCRDKIFLSVEALCLQRIRLSIAAAGGPAGPPLRSIMRLLIPIMVVAKNVSGGWKRIFLNVLFVLFGLFVAFVMLFSPSRSPAFALYLTYLNT